MKARKAALKLLVSAMLVVGLLPVSALAADGEQAIGAEPPAQVQVQNPAQDQAEATAEKGEATESTTDQANPAVVAAADAADEPMAVAYGTYKLYWYALVPGYTLDSGASVNEKWYGMGISTISAKWSPWWYTIGPLSPSQYSNISLVGNPSLFPSIEYEGVTYEYAEEGSPNASKKGYYTLAPERVTVADGANEGKNDYNKPTVRNGTKTFHYDHVLVLNEENIYTVNYVMQDAGESEWTVLPDYAQRVKSGYSEDKLKKPSSAEIPETKTVDGVTYQFDGWYKNKACTQKANFDGTITQNTFYYAHYVPQSGSLSISKSVTGSAANVHQSFMFELSCAALAGKKFAAEGDVVNSVAFDDRGVATVQLKHDQSVTLTGVPSGSQVAVRETGLSGNAKTSSTVSINNGAAETVAANGQTTTEPKTVTVASSQTQTLAFTNSAEAVSATGVSLDAGPMAGLFAVAAAGAGALAATGNKRRKREQDAWKE